MKRIAFACAIGLAFITGMPVRAQNQSGPVMVATWPAPLFLFMQNPNVDALRGLENLTLSVMFNPVEGKATTVAKDAGVDTNTVQTQIATQLRSGGVPIATASPNGLGVVVGLVCAPVESSVCWVQIFLQFGQRLKTSGGQDVRAVTWQDVGGFLVPASNVSPWLSRRIDQAVNQFVRDWKSAH
jgi:hypothetical protein